MIDRRCALSSSILCALFALACDAPEVADDGGALDAGADSATDAAPIDGGECLVISELQMFRLDVEDDTGLRARARIRPDVEGNPWDLYLWFQRIGDAVFTGEIALGAGADASFPDCAHCVFSIRGSSFDRGYFASEGTLRLNRSPFSGRLDLSLEGVVLREMVVEPTDEPIPALMSRWVEGGACLVLPETTLSLPLPPPAWRCDAELYADGEGCDCACGAWDPDCGSCDPFEDPSCDPSARPPVRRCDAGEVCLFDDGEGLCARRCEDTPCSSGFCAYWPEVGRVCVTNPERDSDADIGEVCPEGGGLRYCAVREGEAGGVCAEWYSGLDDGELAVFECWPACARDADCAEGTTCIDFGGTEDGPGYCHPPYPRAWSCDPAAWGDGACDCACGVWDPECGDNTLFTPLPSTRCEAGEVCVREQQYFFGSPGECVAAPANDTCATAIPLPLDADVQGSTRAASPSVGAPGCFEDEVIGPEIVYAVELDAGDALEVTVTPSAEDPVLYLLAPGVACDASATCAATADASHRGGPETLRHTASAPGTYLLVVDGRLFTFDFTLRATVTRAP